MSREYFTFIYNGKKPETDKPIPQEKVTILEITDIEEPTDEETTEIIENDYTGEWLDKAYVSVLEDDFFDIIEITEIHDDYILASFSPNF